MIIMIMIIIITIIIIMMMMMIYLRVGYLADKLTGDTTKTNRKNA